MSDEDDDMYSQSRQENDDVSPLFSSNTTQVLVEELIHSMQHAHGPIVDMVHFLLIYICNFHVLNHFLFMYICKLHWNLQGGKQPTPNDECRSSY
jgi:hypothetical protein